ncbi:MAG TPA: DUF6266 family protein [Chryseolinea sp.]|nr:DUF6266 family protein [Chryseolinea sp.]
MGTFQKGILGGFSGKVGTVVGANWRGKDILRSLPKRSNRIPTASQIEQRLKFALIAHFLRPITIIVSAFFGQRSEYKSRRNLAVSYHMTEAVTGTSPDFLVDYQKVIITKGDLLGLQDAVVTPQAGALLDFAWTDNSGQGLALADDQLIIAVYNESRDLFEYRLGVATRDALTYTMSLPTTWIGETVQCWSSFSNSAGKKAANSIFMGAIVLL